MPFILIAGEVSPRPVSWTTPDERHAALNRWIAIISTEVSRRLPPGPERVVAKDFVYSHRLSVANAFERRIVRADVVSELARLYVPAAGTLTDTCPIKAKDIS